MKYRYLFPRRFADIYVVAIHVLDYGTQRNDVMPHLSLRGAASLYVVRGRSTPAVREALKRRQHEALADRLASNRRL